MKKFLLSLFLVGAFVGFTTPIFAQGSLVLNPESTGGFLIGPIAGINLVSYKTNSFAILNSEPDCFTAQNGSDVAPFFGLSAELPLGETMQNFIIVEAIYDSKSSKFTTQNQSRAIIPTKKNGVVVDGSVTTSETATLNYLLVNLGYKYNFTTGPAPVGPAIQLCISAGLPMTSRLNKSVDVKASSGVPGAGAVSESNQTSAVEVKDHEPGVTAAFRVGARAQFDYDIPLTENGSWVATPCVGYDLPFTQVDNSTYKWTASSLFFGACLRYFIGH
ncbi:MAG: hypothetical protein WCH46_05295 [bacterium]